MAVKSTNPPTQLEQKPPGFQLSRYLPFMDWLFNYKRGDLTGDLIAGVIVAVMLVPQSMAYALLAGLPPQVGLYASIAPLVIYGLLGTSRVLAVGPVAMVSLLVASGIAQQNPADVQAYMQMALVLSLQIAIIQMLMGVLRVGFMVNFLSHPVLSGFTSAAAIIIGFSQVKHVLGYSVPRSEHFHEQVWYTLEHLGQTRFVPLVVGLVAIAILLVFKYQVGDWLKALKLPESVALPITKLGPLVIVVLGTLVVSFLRLDQSAELSIVGAVPQGLPRLTIPLMDFGLWRALLPTALAISLVGYMESISVAKALASKRREKVDADQELIALGASNLGAAFTGGYPVTGGLSRTVVNYAAGANTGLASIITAALIALTVLFLTPLFYYLPNAVLAAIIIVAVANLFDLNAFKHAWKFSKADGASLAVTFIAVLLIGIENGILFGAVAAIGLHLFRTSRPHTAIIGRINNTEHFRNVERHDVETHPDLLLVRVDESLYFPNAAYLENQILCAVADNPEIEHLVLVCSAVNTIDASALEVLEALRRELKDAGVIFYLAEVKGPVMDKLQKIGFIDEIGKDNVFLSANEAFERLPASGKTAAASASAS
jgi:sulfate permease, SulP family